MLNLRCCHSHNLNLNLNLYGLCSPEKEENDFSLLWYLTHFTGLLFHMSSCQLRIEMTSTAKSEATPPDVVQAMLDNSLKGAAIRDYRFSYFRSIICCH
jgi:hypothetical protein